MKVQNVAFMISSLAIWSTVFVKIEMMNVIQYVSLRHASLIKPYLFYYIQKLRFLSKISKQGIGTDTMSSFFFKSSSASVMASSKVGADAGHKKLSGVIPRLLPG